MKRERLYVISLLVAILILHEPTDGKRVTIHVPYGVKRVKHTHTVYKVIPHEHRKKKYYHVEEPESEEFDHYKK